MKDIIFDRIARWWYSFARWMCRFFCVAFFQYRVHGKKNIPTKGPVVLVSNHQSFLDPLFCGMPLHRTMSFVARESLFKNWFFGKLIASVGTIPLKRNESDLRAIKTILKKLRSGKGVCLFPEGTRSEDGRIADFKPGFGLLCRKSNACLVPVLIEGGYECWPRISRCFRPGSRVQVNYGQAIYPDQMANLSDQQLANKVTDMLRKMQNQCRIKQGKQPFDYSNSANS